jgi:nucleoside-triphosphatase
LHIFLQGALKTGKSTVIRKTLDILTARRPLKIGGFMTWRGKDPDPNVYVQPAMPGREHEKCLLATHYTDDRGTVCDPVIFDRQGVRLLTEIPDADLIIMDELGYLERGALVFQQAVLDILARDIPVIGTMRMKDIPWHEPIKADPRVSLLKVTLENRDTLPRDIAALLPPFGQV